MKRCALAAMDALSTRSRNPSASPSAPIHPYDMLSAPPTDKVGQSRENNGKDAHTTSELVAYRV
eukprot:2184976-Pyramimonas_sp.AAC.1